MQYYDWRFSKRSIKNLIGVHPELALIASRALLLSPVDFAITHGLRTFEEQQALFEDGKSQTMNSRHLTGDAIDVAAYVEGQLSWEFEYYEEIANAFKRAANGLGLICEWGGDWVSFKDGVHFQRVRTTPNG